MFEWLFGSKDDERPFEHCLFGQTDLTRAELRKMRDEEIASVEQDLTDGVIGKREYKKLMKMIKNCRHYNV